MRSLRAALAASVAALALLGACSDDDPSPGDPSSTWTPTGKPETPTSDATAKPTEPALPEAATKATEDGARAFIAYYWDAVNYAQATGDVRRLNSLSAHSCDTCRGVAADLRAHYRSGGRIDGGDNSVHITEAAELSTSSGAAFGFRIEQVVSHEQQTIVEGDGSEDQRDAGSNRFTAYVLWVDEDHWRLDVMEPK